MKIVYYTDQIFLHGGLERVIANKLNFLSTIKGIDLHLITFQQENKPPCYIIPKSVTLHNISIPYERTKSFLHPSNIKYAITHYTRLKKKINEIMPDVIVVCNYEYGFYFIPLITKKTIKIKEYHSSRHFYDHKRRNNKNPLKKLIYQISDYFESKYNYLILLTEDELKYYKSNNKVVIPNAITSINPKTASLTHKKIICAGRIAPVKGFETLIKSWALVIKKFPDWILNIYGDGEQEYVASLETLINNLALNQKVFLRGSTKNLEDKMLESSIYVMSSETECFPMVLLEAMSCGLPIVSFDCPNGPRNIITNKVDGVLVKPNDYNELANSIMNLIENPIIWNKYSTNAKINIQRFTENHIMPKWLKIFKIK